MSAHDENRIQQLLKQALPPLQGDPEPDRDLWPAVLRRFEAQPVPQSRFRWVWFDWALLAGLTAVTVTFPSSMALLLYYL